MAKGKSLGKAYVQIMPSAEGIKGSVAKILAPEASEAGTICGALFSKNFKSATNSIGAELSDSIANSIDVDKESCKTLGKEISDSVADGVDPVDADDVIDEKIKDEIGEKGSESGEEFGKKFKKTISSALVAGTIGKAIAASITEGAALEQSLGGVETLFKENADKVVKYADEAFRTAGVSANTYMEQVTSFSATLLQGLGGDTAKAAEYANTAMIDMSDNANKFGTDMQSIQNAYQGFAKQNYTMLDNLKLGYGGTQEEMARLINDSGVLGESITVTAETVKDVPFSDIISAIHTIQSNLGVTGTTAEEASSTISGSFQSMKASASNLLGHLSTGTGNLDEDFKNLTKSAETFAGGNLLPAIKRINSALDESDGALGLVYDSAKGVAAAIAAIKLVQFSNDIKNGTGNLGKFADKLKECGSFSEVFGKLKSGANGASLAIAAATVVATLIARQIDKATDNIEEAVDGYNALSESQKALVESTNKISEAVNNAVASSQELTGDAESQSAAYSSLKDRLYELDDAQTISNESRAEMQSIVEQLNGSIPGLNLLLDTETGHLVNQREAVDNLVESYAKQAKAQAAQESLVELYKQQYEAEKNLDNAEKQRQGAMNERSRLQLQLASQQAEYNRLLNTWRTAENDSQIDSQMAVLKVAIDETSAAIKEQDDILGDINKTYSDAGSAVRSVNGEISDMTAIVRDNADASNGAASAVNSYSQALDSAKSSSASVYTVSQESFDKITEITKAYSEAAGNIDETTRGIADSLNVFSAYNWDDELNADEMFANLQSNIDAMDWGTNGLDVLRQNAKDAGFEIDENLISKLEEMGPEAANQIYAMAQMSGEELKNYSDLYGKYYGMAREKADSELEKLKKDSGMQIQAIMEEAEHHAVPLSETYEYLAGCAAKGYADGIDTSSGILTDAGKRIFFAVEEGYKEASETHSPSRAMRRLGRFLPEGAALGIEDGTDAVKSSAANMAKAAISSAEPLRATIPAADIDIGTVRRAAARYDYGSAQTAVKSDGTGGKNKPAVINLNINGRTFAQATADFIDLENGATLSLKERGVAR